MQPEICLLCEDSLEGILTAVYEAYRLKLCHETTRIVCGEEQWRLFTEYMRIETEEEKARKVIRTLKGRFGGGTAGQEEYEVPCTGAGRTYLPDVFQAVCLAAASGHDGKADAIYHTIVKGLRAREPALVMGDLADDAVRTVFELSRAVNNEILHLRGFLRFEETKEGVLFARIGPKNDVLPYLAPHFADRLPQENFVIYDENRECLVLHPAGRAWYIQRSVLVERDRFRYSEREEEYQELFRYFCHKIAIKERENKELQQNMLPLRFQSYMTEFVKKKH